MMDYLYNKGDHVAYTVMVLIAAMSGFLGFVFGYQDPAVLCADQVIEIDRLQKKLLECGEKQAKDSAIEVGKVTLESCKLICDENVKEALDNYKDIMCDD